MAFQGFCLIILSLCEFLNSVRWLQCSQDISTESVDGNPRDLYFLLLLCCFSWEETFGCFSTTYLRLSESTSLQSSASCCHSSRCAHQLNPFSCGWAADKWRAPESAVICFWPRAPSQHAPQHSCLLNSPYQHEHLTLQCHHQSVSSSIPKSECEPHRLLYGFIAPLYLYQLLQPAALPTSL